MDKAIEHEGGAAVNGEAAETDDANEYAAAYNAIHANAETICALYELLDATISEPLELSCAGRIGLARILKRIAGEMSESLNRLPFPHDFASMLRRANG